MSTIGGGMGNKATRHKRMAVVLIISEQNEYSDSYAKLYKNTITFQSFEEYPHSNPRSMWKQQHHSLSFNLIDMNDGT